MLLSLVMRIRLHVLLVSLFIMLFISLTVSLARAQPCLELKAAYLAMAAILNMLVKTPSETRGSALTLAPRIPAFRLYPGYSPFT
jgi:hypothetical protein